MRQPAVLKHLISGKHKKEMNKVTFTTHSKNQTNSFLKEGWGQ